MSFDAPLLRIRAAVRILKGEFQMKQYQKPEVNYEDFMLAEHIALCDYRIQSGDADGCHIIDDRFEDDGAFFKGGFAKVIAENGPCSFKVDRYCYTNGGAGMPKIFQS